jgi:hypothetical protein
MPTITVRIGKDGEAKITMAGVQGPACLKMTEALREGLGVTLELVRTAECGEGEETENENEIVQE